MSRKRLCERVSPLGVPLHRMAYISPQIDLSGRVYGSWLAAVEGGEMR